MKHINQRIFSSILGFVALVPGAILAQSSIDLIRLNELQVIGTHNSYHLEPSKPVMELIKGFNAEAADSIAYSHKSIEEQLGHLGIRQLEWDLYADPNGGLFANPAVRQIITDRGGDPGPSHDPNGVLNKPGLKIIHSPDFDFLTTSLTFRQALTSLRDWSQAHPHHVPIMVLLEVKESSGWPSGVTPLKFDAEQFDGIDQEILSVFQKDEILSPDEVRGDAETLRKAILKNGWPLLESVRGKILFALDNGGSVRDRYVSGHPSLRGRLLFASVDEKDPAAAWFKINDPIQGFDSIQRLVRQGFMVRTRADANTKQARTNDPTRRDKAFASGAQFVSTDYPAANLEFSRYRVQFTGGVVARPNPVTGQADLGEIDLDKARAWIVCEGTYGGHLQGVATDGISLYWSHTVQLVKTDLNGRILQQISVPDHHGDLTLHDGKVFVAVEFGEFNEPPGASEPWIYIYDADSLKLLGKRRVPELVHGAGSIAYGNERFVVVGGLPGDHDQNYVFEYDKNLNFLNRHVLPSKQTRLGIQTAAYMDGHWWFGCYGSPENPGLLKVDKNFLLVGQAETNFSYGVARLNNSTIIRGECFAGSKRGKVELLRGELSQVQSVTTSVRLAAYNVLFGIWAEPEVIGEMFKPYEFDAIGFSEVPDGDWTSRVGRVLGMEHVYVGKISSANHEDKFKSILSRTPLTNTHEIELTGHKGWSPASLVGAETFIRGMPFLVYSTHIPGRPNEDGSAAEFIAQSIIPNAHEKAENVVILGDLNNLPGDGPLERIESAGMRSMWTDLGIDTTKLSSHLHIESGKESGVIDHIYYTSASKAEATDGGIIYSAFNAHDADKEMPNYKADWKQYGKPLSDHRPVWAVVEFPLR